MISNNPGQNWAIYEANVQQYRVLSATVQSFFLTIGSIVFTASSQVPSLLLSLIFLIGVLHVLWVWIPVVYARHKVVDYYKFQHDHGLSDEDRLSLANFCKEKQYVEDAKLRREVNRKFFGNADLSVWRLTRIKLDLIVPLSYVVFWIGLYLWKRPWPMSLWN